MNTSILDEVQELLKEVDALDHATWPRGSEWSASIISQRAQLRELLRRLVAYHSGFAMVAAEHRALLKQLKSFTEERKKADGTSRLGLKVGSLPRLLEMLDEALDHDGSHDETHSRLS